MVNPRTRFRVLTLKEALGTATADELKKLERYTALLRPPIEVPREVLVESYRIKLIQKYARAAIHGHEGLRVVVNLSRVVHGQWPAR